MKKKMNEKRKEKIYQAIVEKSRKQLQEGIKKYQSIDAFAKDLGNLNTKNCVCVMRDGIPFQKKIVRGRQNCNHETNK